MSTPHNFHFFVPKIGDFGSIPEKVFTIRGTVGVSEIWESLIFFCLEGPGDLIFWSVFLE